MLIHYLPHVMGCSECLLHAVLQSRKLAHRVITAKEEEEKCNELRRVHPLCHDLTLAEKEKQHDEDNSDHLDRRWRSSCNARTPQVCPYNSLGNLSEAFRLALFRAISFHDTLVRERLLRGVRQFFASFKTLAREVAQRLAKLSRQHRDNRSNQK